MTAPRSTSGPLTDDRGQSVPEWSGARRGNDPFEQELAIRLAHVTQVRAQKLGLIAAPVFMATFIGLALVGMPSWAIFFPAAFIIAFMLLVGRWARRAERARVAPTLLGAGRCASCAYPIAKLPPERDGCVSCPECGAAWRFDPDWARRLEVSDAAAESNLNLPRDGTADDRAAIQWFGRFFGGLSGRRSLAMRDDRGRLVTIFFPRFPWKNPAGWDEVDPAARRMLKKEIRRLGWPWRVFFGFCLTFPAALQIPWMVRPPPTFGVPAVFSVVVFLWVFVFLPLTIFGMAVFPWVRQPRTLARVFLRRGLCPGCASDLRRMGPDAGGLRECRRCLASWKLEDVPSASPSGST